MPSMNKVILMGHLTRDVELQHLPSGSTVGKFGLAINRKWTGKDGQKSEETCFVDCVAWGKQAETLAQYVRKGSALLVEGRLKLEQWESKDGQKRSRLVVVVENFQFVGAKGVSGTDSAAPANENEAAMFAQSPSGDGDEVPF